jgi:hypothetical protein
MPEFRAPFNRSTSPGSTSTGSTSTCSTSAGSGNPVSIGRNSLAIESTPCRRQTPRPRRLALPGRLSRTGLSPEVVKVGILAVVIVAASTLAVRGLGSFSVRERPRTERATEDQAPDPETQVQRRFADVDTDEDAIEQMDRYAAEITRLATDIRNEDRARVAAAAQAVLTPLVLGSAEMFQDALVGMGAQAGEQTDEQASPIGGPLFAMLSAVLTHAQFDLSELVVGVPSSDGMAAGSAMRREEREVEGDGQSGERTQRNVSAMRLTTDSIFPDIERSADSGSVIDISVPVRTEGSDMPGGDLLLTVRMSWNAQLSVWQPGMFELAVYNPEIAERMMTAARSSGTLRRQPRVEPSGSGP